ncbi:MAG: toll/interleukin-1 receptor domain-containing protein, partial [Lachnospiraceae bacterium]|nr:toll/interleukin-1 receptor domain-containing protein [Lachnospiraceae bacterium]
MKRDIFISHSSKDNKLASELCEYLEANGKSCFIAPRDIRYGKEYAEEIVDGIDDSKAMILLLSEQSNQSPHVLREVERAVSKSIPILIYKLENVELSKSMEYFLMAHQWL